MSEPSDDYASQSPDLPPTLGITIHGARIPNWWIPRPFEPNFGYAYGSAEVFSYLDPTAPPLFDTSAPRPPSPSVPIDGRLVDWSVWIRTPDPVLLDAAVRTLEALVVQDLEEAPELVFTRWGLPARHAVLRVQHQLTRRNGRFINYWTQAVEYVRNATIPALAWGGEGSLWGRSPSAEEIDRRCSFAPWAIWQPFFTKERKRVPLSAAELIHQHQHLPVDLVAETLQCQPQSDAAVRHFLPTPRYALALAGNRHLTTHQVRTVAEWLYDVASSQAQFGEPSHLESLAILGNRHRYPVELMSEAQGDVTDASASTAVAAGAVLASTAQLDPAHWWTSATPAVQHHPVIRAALVRHPLTSPTLRNTLLGLTAVAGGSADPQGALTGAVILALLRWPLRPRNHERQWWYDCLKAGPKALGEAWALLPLWDHCNALHTEIWMVRTPPEHIQVMTEQCSTLFLGWPAPLRLAANKPGLWPPFLLSQLHRAMRLAKDRGADSLVSPVPLEGCATE